MQLWVPGGRLLAACPTAGQKYSYVIRKNLGANPSGPRCRLGGPRCRALGPRWEEAGGGVPYCWPEMAATAPSLPRPDPHPLPSVATSVITYHHHHRHHDHHHHHHCHHHHQCPLLYHLMIYMMAIIAGLVTPVCFMLINIKQSPPSHDPITTR